MLSSRRAQGERACYVTPNELFATLNGLATGLEPGSLLEATPECLVIAGTDGRIVFANSRLEELTGFTREELVGEPVDMLLPDAPVRTSLESRFEAICDRRDAGPLPCEVHLGSVEQPTYLVVVTLRDMPDLMTGV